MGLGRGDEESLHGEHRGPGGSLHAFELKNSCETFKTFKTRHFVLAQ
jgi:hypothetical protein